MSESSDGPSAAESERNPNGRRVAAPVLWAAEPFRVFFPLGITAATPLVFRFGKLFVWQGMLLLPILGVGSYLFPRFFGAPAAVPPRKRAAGVWLAAAIVLLSFLLEAAGVLRAGQGLRAVAVLISHHIYAAVLWAGICGGWLVRHLPLWRREASSE